MRRLLTISLLALAAPLVAVPTALAATGPAPTHHSRHADARERRQPADDHAAPTSRRGGSRTRSSSAVPTAARRSRSRAAPRRRSSSSACPLRSRAFCASRDSKQRPTRLKLRVLSGQFSKFTSRRLSPVITAVGDGDGGGGGGGGGGTPAVCNSSADHDGDLLLEQPGARDRHRPVPRGHRQRPDVGRLGVLRRQGPERQGRAVPRQEALPERARSLRRRAARVRASASIDFDGDGLTTLEEYRAWRYTGSSFDVSKAGGLDLESPLGYSDGTKFSRSSETPSVPPGAARTTVCRLRRSPSRRRSTSTVTLRGGMTSATPTPTGSRTSSRPCAVPATRLVGGLLLPAGHEGGRMAQARDPCGQEFGAFNERPFADLDMADPDVDGDTLLDGEDDQDNDDYTNIREIYEARLRPRRRRRLHAAAPSPTRASTWIRAAESIRWESTPSTPAHRIPTPAPARTGSPSAKQLPSNAVPPPTWRPHPRL